MGWKEASDKRYDDAANADIYDEHKNLYHDGCPVTDLYEVLFYVLEAVVLKYQNWKFMIRVISTYEIAQISDQLW